MELCFWLACLLSGVCDLPSGLWIPWEHWRVLPGMSPAKSDSPASQILVEQESTSSSTDHRSIVPEGL